MNIYNISSIFGPNLNIYIDRKSLFYDAHNEIMNKSVYELKKGFNIKYMGEIGVDCGGLLR